MLSSWQNFYIIVGAAAATLTGLMFIVITLMEGIGRQPSSLDAAISAFSTPTMVHFCAVLLMAGILSAPWGALSSVALLLGLLGLGGVAYLIIVIRRMRRMPDYRLSITDRVWYISLPIGVYLTLVAASILLPSHPAPVLYFIGAVMFALLIIGIHNAWDLVIFIALERTNNRNK